MESQRKEGLYEKELTNLANLAITEISRMPAPVIQICGPISTGGFGKTQDNLEYLSSIIGATTVANISVFNQVAYEARLDKILKHHVGYDFPILDYFYKPILTSGNVHGLVFLPLWNTSIGSSWEHEMGKTLGIPIFFLEKILVSEIELFISQIKKKGKK